MEAGVPGPEALGGLRPVAPVLCAASSSSAVPTAALAEPTIIMQASELKDHVNEVDAEKMLLLEQVARTKCDVVEGPSVLTEPSSEKLLVGDGDALEKKVSVWGKRLSWYPKKR